MRDDGRAGGAREHSSGERSIFGAGDAFVVPAGFEGTWEVARGLLEDLRDFRGTQLSAGRLWSPDITRHRHDGGRRFATACFYACARGVNVAFLSLRSVGPGGASWKQSLLPPRVAAGPDQSVGDGTARGQRHRHRSARLDGVLAHPPRSPGSSRLSQLRRRPWAPMGDPCRGACAPAAACLIAAPAAPQ